MGAPDGWLWLLSLPVLAWALVTAGVGLTMAYALRRGRSEPRDSEQERVFADAPRGALTAGRALLREGTLQTLAFALQAVHPFLPRQRLAAGSGGDLVLLVPGYLENGGLLRPLARSLRRRGYAALAVDLPSTLRALEENADHLAAVAREALARTGSERVALVGHSMGGLVARACAQRHPDLPVGALVSLCSPHRGTHLARLGPGASARAMRPDSPTLRALAGAARVPALSLVAAHDNIVSPAWSSVLPGAEHHLLERPVGHVGALFDPAVAARVAGWLEAVGLVPADACGEGVRAPSSGGARARVDARS